MQSHLDILQASFQKAIDRAGIETLSQLFFSRFFDTWPETRTYFIGTDVDYFRKKKIRIIFEFLTDIIKHSQYAEDQIAQEVIRHQMYGLKDQEYYYTLANCLYQAVKTTLDDQWDEETETAWNDILLVFKGLVAQAVETYL